MNNMTSKEGKKVGDALREARDFIIDNHCDEMIPAAVVIFFMKLDITIAELKIFMDGTPATDRSINRIRAIIND